jgi:hypothetical protein
MVVNLNHARSCTAHHAGPALKNKTEIQCINAGVATSCTPQASAYFTSATSSGDDAWYSSAPSAAAEGVTLGRKRRGLVL